MGLAYVCGPMRNYPLYNFPAFDDARDRLRAAGWEVISPADLDRQVGIDETTVPLPPNFLRQAMARDLSAVCECDAIALLPGWQDSEGAILETALAKTLGLRVIDAVTLEDVSVTLTQKVARD